MADWRWVHNWWVRILLVILLLLPYLLWQFAPSHRLRVLIVDKTVPQEDWREHLGLAGVLSHHKIIRPGGGLYDPTAGQT